MAQPPRGRSHAPSSGSRMINPDAHGKRARRCPQVGMVAKAPSNRRRQSTDTARTAGRGRQTGSKEREPVRGAFQQPRLCRRPVPSRIQVPAAVAAQRKARQIDGSARSTRRACGAEYVAADMRQVQAPQRRRRYSANSSRRLLLNIVCRSEQAGQV